MNCSRIMRCSLFWNQCMSWDSRAKTQQRNISHLQNITQSAKQLLQGLCAENRGEIYEKQNKRATPCSQNCPGHPHCHLHGRLHYRGNNDGKCICCGASRNRGGIPEQYWSRSGTAGACYEVVRNLGIKMRGKADVVPDWEPRTQGKSRTG